MLITHSPFLPMSSHSGTHSSKRLPLLGKCKRYILPVRKAQRTQIGPKTTKDSHQPSKPSAGTSQLVPTMRKEINAIAFIGEQQQIPFVSSSYPGSHLCVTFLLRTLGSLVQLCPWHLTWMATRLFKPYMPNFGGNEENLNMNGHHKRQKCIHLER